MTPPENTPPAKPFVKWAGGKTQLLPELNARAPHTFGTYHEPFLGGGAFFFDLYNHARLTASRLTDINPHLVDAYLAVRDHVEDIIPLLAEHKAQHSEPYFYQVRAQQPDTLPLSERAARLLYLNKTCYNGLYRENRSGQFNVPFGRYKNPSIYDEDNLRAASRALQTATIEQAHFSDVLNQIQTGDFVYFDPPYHPVSSTANFTAYSKNSFGETEQTQLRDVFAALAARDVYVMLSNSDTPFIRALYQDFTIGEVWASRQINSKATKRGRVGEVIVSNAVQAWETLTIAPDHTLLNSVSV